MVTNGALHTKTVMARLVALDGNTAPRPYPMCMDPMLMRTVTTAMPCLCLRGANPVRHLPDHPSSVQLCRRVCAAQQHPGTSQGKEGGPG